MFASSARAAGNSARNHRSPATASASSSSVASSSFIACSTPLSAFTPSSKLPRPLSSSSSPYLASSPRTPERVSTSTSIWQACRNGDAAFVALFVQQCRSSSFVAASLASTSSSSSSSTSSSAASAYLDHHNPHETLNVLNEAFETPLHVAASHNQLACVALLIDANPFSTSSSAPSASNPNSSSLPSFAPCHINAADRESNWTALHRACYAGFLSVASLLIQAHADPTLLDHDRLTAFDLLVTRLDYSRFLRLDVRHRPFAPSRRNAKNALAGLHARTSEGAESLGLIAEPVHDDEEEEEAGSDARFTFSAFKKLSARERRRAEREFRVRLFRERSRLQLYAFGNNVHLSMGVAQAEGMVRKPRAVLMYEYQQQPSSAFVSSSSSSSSSPFTSSALPRPSRSPSSSVALPLADIQMMALTRSCSFALSRKGELFAMGSGSQHRLGVGENCTLLQARALPTKLRFSHVDACELYTAAVTEKGEVFVWGAWPHEWLEIAPSVTSSSSSPSFTSTSSNLSASTSDQAIVSPFKLDCCRGQRIIAVTCAPQRLMLLNEHGDALFLGQSLEDSPPSSSSQISTSSSSTSSSSPLRPIVAFSSLKLSALVAARDGAIALTHDGEIWQSLRRDRRAFRVSLKVSDIASHVAASTASGTLSSSEPLSSAFSPSPAPQTGMSARRFPRVIKICSSPGGERALAVTESGQCYWWKINELPLPTSSSASSSSSSSSSSFSSSSSSSSFSATQLSITHSPTLRSQDNDNTSSFPAFSLTSSSSSSSSLGSGRRIAYLVGGLSHVHVVDACIGKGHTTVVSRDGGVYHFGPAALTSSLSSASTASSASASGASSSSASSSASALLPQRNHYLHSARRVWCTDAHVHVSCVYYQPEPCDGSSSSSSTASFASLQRNKQAEAHFTVRSLRSMCELSLLPHVSIHSLFPALSFAISYALPLLLDHALLFLLSNLNILIHPLLKRMTLQEMALIEAAYQIGRRDRSDRDFEAEEDEDDIGAAAERLKELEAVAGQILARASYRASSSLLSSSSSSSATSSRHTPSISSSASPLLFPTSSIPAMTHLSPVLSSIGVGSLSVSAASTRSSDDEETDKSRAEFVVDSEEDWEFEKEEVDSAAALHEVEEAIEYEHNGQVNLFSIHQHRARQQERFESARIRRRARRLEAIEERQKEREKEEDDAWRRGLSDDQIVLKLRSMWKNFKKKEKKLQKRDDATAASTASLRARTGSEDGAQAESNEGRAGADEAEDLADEVDEDEMPVIRAQSQEARDLFIRTERVKNELRRFADRGSSLAALVLSERPLNIAQISLAIEQKSQQEQHGTTEEPAAAAAETKPAVLDSVQKVQPRAQASVPKASHLQQKLASLSTPSPAIALQPASAAAADSSPKPSTQIPGSAAPPARKDLTSALQLSSSPSSSSSASSSTPSTGRSLFARIQQEQAEAEAEATRTAASRMTPRRHLAASPPVPAAASLLSASMRASASAWQQRVSPELGSASPPPAPAALSLLDIQAEERRKQKATAAARAVFSSASPKQPSALHPSPSASSSSSSSSLASSFVAHAAITPPFMLSLADLMPEKRGSLSSAASPVAPARASSPAPAKTWGAPLSSSSPPLMLSTSSPPLSSTAVAASQPPSLSFRDIQSAEAARNLSSSSASSNSSSALLSRSILSSPWGKGHFNSVIDAPASTPLNVIQTVELIRVEEERLRAEIEAQLEVKRREIEEDAARAKAAKAARKKERAKKARQLLQNSLTSPQAAPSSSFASSSNVSAASSCGDEPPKRYRSSREGTVSAENDAQVQRGRGLGRSSGRGARGGGTGRGRGVDRGRDNGRGRAPTRGRSGIAVNSVDAHASVPVQ